MRVRRRSSCASHLPDGKCFCRPTMWQCRLAGFRRRRSGHRSGSAALRQVAERDPAPQVSRPRRPEYGGERSLRLSVEIVELHGNPLACGMAVLQRWRSARLPGLLRRPPVHARHRMRPVPPPLVRLQHVFHASCACGIHRRPDHPQGYLPRATPFLTPPCCLSSDRVCEAACNDLFPQPSRGAPDAARSRGARESRPARNARRPYRPLRFHQVQPAMQERAKRSSKCRG